MGARASPLGRWGKVETTLTHLWTSQWQMSGKIGDTCPQARLRGPLHMCRQPHPCLSHWEHPSALREVPGGLRRLAFRTPLAEARDKGTRSPVFKALRPGGQNNTGVKHTNSSQTSETAVLAPAFMSLSCGWVTWYLYV